MTTSPGHVYGELDQNLPRLENGTDRAGKQITQLMKPAKYNGTGPIESYIRQYEICARHNGWGPRENVTFVSRRLKVLPLRFVEFARGRGPNL